MIIIDAQGLAASRPNRPLFADVSITISDGDRVGVVGVSAEAPGVDLAGWRGSVKAGLMSLGWNSALADDAVAALPEPAGEPDVAALLKAALVQLDRR